MYVVNQCQTTVWLPTQNLFGAPDPWGALLKMGFEIGDTADGLTFVTLPKGWSLEDGKPLPKSLPGWEVTVYPDSAIIKDDKERIRCRLLQMNWGKGKRGEPDAFLQSRFNVEYRDLESGSILSPTWKAEASLLLSDEGLPFFRADFSLPRNPFIRGKATKALLTLKDSLVEKLGDSLRLNDPTSLWGDNCQALLDKACTSAHEEIMAAAPSLARLVKKQTILPLTAG